MKTPREILFERHRQAQPRLDAVRWKALATLSPAEDATRAHPEEGLAKSLVSQSSDLADANPALESARGNVLFILAFLKKAWLELIWRSRRVWAGMGVLWLAARAANLEMKTTSPEVPAVRSAVSRELAQAFEEQRRLLAELLPPADPPLVIITRPNARPRSERLTLFKGC